MKREGSLEGTLLKGIWVPILNLSLSLTVGTSSTFVKCVASAESVYIHSFFLSKSVLLRCKLYTGKPSASLLKPRLSFKIPLILQGILNAMLMKVFSDFLPVTSNPFVLES